MPEPTVSPDLHALFKAYDVRGTVPDQLNEDVAGAIGRAFGHEVSTAAPTPPTVVVGHDMRPDSPALSAAFARGAAGAGCDVVLIGLCSTDGLYYASGSMDAPGAMFTASHNPAGYNGIKMCRAGARPIGQGSGLERIRDHAAQILAAQILAAPTDPRLDGGPDARHGTLREQDVLVDYARHLRSLVDLSGGRQLTVVVDAGNGMAGHTVPAVLTAAAGLAELPLTVLPLYFELDGTFPHHEANPLVPENLVDLQAEVRRTGADLGLAFDGDADRCFVVDENGDPVDPSTVTAMVAEREIAKEHAAGRTATVLHNLISSRAVPEVVRQAGGAPVRTRVGHSFIKAEMVRTGAVFGGEHSAHYYFRDFWSADTGMLAAMHVLAALAEQTEPLSRVTARFARYASSGEVNSRVADPRTAMAVVRAEFEHRPGVVVDDLDGFTVNGPVGEEPMWWFNLRSSNTEPLLRLNVEASDTATVVAVRDEVLDLVRGTV